MPGTGDKILNGFRGGPQSLETLITFDYHYNNNNKQLFVGYPVSSRRFYFMPSLFDFLKYIRDRYCYYFHFTNSKSETEGD